MAQENKMKEYTVRVFDDGRKEWFFDGVWLSEEEFNARTKVKEVIINGLEKLLGCKVKVVGSVVMRD